MREENEKRKEEERQRGTWHLRHTLDRVKSVRTSPSGAQTHPANKGNGGA